MDMLAPLRSDRRSVLEPLQFSLCHDNIHFGGFALGAFGKQDLGLIADRSKGRKQLHAALTFRAHGKLWNRLVHLRINVSGGKFGPPRYFVLEWEGCNN